MSDSTPLENATSAAEALAAARREYAALAAGLQADLRPHFDLLDRLHAQASEFEQDLRNLPPPSAIPPAPPPKSPTWLAQEVRSRVVKNSSNPQPALPPTSEEGRNDG